MNVTPRRRTAFPVKVAKNTCFMLTLTRHEIHHTKKYPNTNNYLYSHTYLHDNTNSEPVDKPPHLLSICAPFLDLNLSITNGIVSSKIYDKRDDFNFEIVNFPFLDGYVPRSPSYGVYISQLIRFARVCSNVDDFNNRNLFLTAKLFKQGYRYHKIRKAFSKFYYRHSELIVKYNIGLKTLLQQGISEPIFYGDLVYKFKRIVGNPNFSDQFKTIVKRYIRVGYNLDIMRQSACLVLNPITVYSYGFLFNCTTVGQASDSMTALT